MVTTLTPASGHPDLEQISTPIGSSALDVAGGRYFFRILETKEVDYDLPDRGYGIYLATADVRTGVVTLSPKMTGDVIALEFDAANDQLLGHTDKGELASVNPATGTITVLTSASGVPQFPGESGGQKGMLQIPVGSSTIDVEGERYFFQVSFLSDDGTGTSLGGPYLASADIETGIVSLSPELSQGVVALGYDPVLDRVLGQTQDGELVEIDTETGEVTQLTPPDGRPELENLQTPTGGFAMNAVVGRYGFTLVGDGPDGFGLYLATADAATGRFFISPKLTDGPVALEFLPGTDIDSDGVDVGVEDAAPNDGDGNDDGTPDNHQANVTSVPSATDDPEYVSLQTQTWLGLRDVAAVDNPSPGDEPTGTEFPLGHFDFGVEGLLPGGATTLTLYLPDDTEVDTYYMYSPTPDDPTPHWYEFLFDGTTGAEIFAGVDDDTDPEMIILHFVDGGRGDADLTANGVIVDPGSPARSVPAVSVPRVRAYFAVGAGAGGASVATLYNPDGSEAFTFDAFDGFTGGIRVASGDFNNDGVGDLVIGTGPGRATLVQVISGADMAVLFEIRPFESGFTGGVYVAAGDFDGDGFDDLAISPDEGGGPRVRLFGGKDFSQIADFFGIDDPNFRGGARSALADLNNDGRADLLVAAGFGGGPRVAGFDATSLGGTPVKLFADFFLFEQKLRNGAFIAGGDLNGDGFADVIGGGGPDGGLRVFAISGKELLAGTQTPVANFFAGDVNNRGGVRVVAADLDGDERIDLVTGAGDKGGSRVTLYAGETLGNDSPTELLGLEGFPGFSNGVFVG